MGKHWIDFTELKQAVHEHGGLREVLDRYGFLASLTDKGGGKLVGPCPIHGSTDQTSTAFHADCNRDVWHCFSQCTTDRGKSGGSILELVMLVDGCTLREAGERLAGWFNLSFDRPRGNGRALAKPGRGDREAVKRPAVATHTSRQVSAVNPPLERPLKNLNHDHPYLFARGLTVPTIRTFGLGFCTRGLMRGRIAIPIHNEANELVAYAGRAIDEESGKEEGKYRLPTGFHKSHVLYNLNRAREHGCERGLIVVEGFFDAMKVHQVGFPNVVALMGCALSEEQEQLLVEHTDRLALMFDGDEAGDKCIREFYGKLRRRMYLREIHLVTGEQPDVLSDERLRKLLA